ncbi:hypothetical protein [[Mycobacterium] holstebronense]|uniref:Alanine and proline rich membrane protein n=1 Tax=[Mycobacterium] holstebronense TaxID=3064288 RepID=A0ABM9LAP2_9MYCO|nr:hypothetical protein [Mycolicibacter sp. MU0102]CAJ1495833.1 hypothetical protein MU0102_000067 [Mycolicibacter sp. MU0102]
MVAALGALLGIGSMLLAIVAFTRAPASPTYSTAQKTAAKTDLCGQFKPAMDAVHIETNGPDAGFGRIALVNGALILEGASSDPALDPNLRDVAKAVVLTYKDLVVESTLSSAGKSPFDNAVDAVNAKEHVLKDLCSD